MDETGDEHNEIGCEERMSSIPIEEQEEQLDLNEDNEAEEAMDDTAFDADQVEDFEEVEEMKEAVEIEGVEEEGSEEDDEQSVEAKGVAEGASPMTNDKEYKGENDLESKKHAELLALPPHGSEIFIGGIPREATEEDLRRLCEQIGEIAELRLLEDKATGAHKGYAFVTFRSEELAQIAIDEINGKEFKGRNLRCSHSQAKNRLFVGNIPKNWIEEDLKRVVEEIGSGVINVELILDLQRSGNKGYAFLEYYNSACADYARQKMSSPGFKLDSNTPTVRWADPKNTADHDLTSQVKVVYVKNLPEDVKQEQLKEIFEPHGEVTRIVLPPVKPGQGAYGFIHFAKRASALNAVNETKKYEINGHAFEATMAKPQTDRRNDPASAYRGSYIPPYSSHADYGVGGTAYGALGGSSRAGGFTQPMIYGRGPAPMGMSMVPVLLPDGQVGYVLQEPGTQIPPQRSGRSGGPVGQQGRGRRYRPY
ncbi:heterogeneous nuclear ribonucleoprotein R [Amborella trichopoda]|uniref:RRM domain-containing protein n=1 Tax=Amborella trichopoda TaxID=13333 RepID=W1PKT1_AMBTC|nr:heterogeneous nuclear ribonucleoprotein R [Amborella trichopoda]XP_011624214.1 heterogeneous nuclear ribonucleoprotein R [Amborella trichopoda]XP_020524262.1 heterogeneous nuclear ribonucleoprotein R [Amborella trichopoda]XP_020524263.1 heterogeneous nuclear ribonucleoprotein R [Amborella trichopoda]XP_020524264.1 heterogeneous nuclear ribonucleoprotein R [Amborella trichopoda]XP_020524265.1 heterogeneous nuclear ribonucleoprotein R [Amborella trichopoda]XP_020524266.1 heterogeneous nuclea|eukprot:XP_006846586.1 heterogeneous nuclear ribonucleoprotein R [Amborella trichopoda]